MSNCKLTDLQKTILREFMNHTISEKEFCEKFGMDEKEFARLIKNDKEETIFSQTLSEDELRAVSGGMFKDCDRNLDEMCGYLYKEKDPQYPCVNMHHRGIYEDGGFPNCTSGVEDGSYCWTNDACYGAAIVYDGMIECHKAWR